MAFPSLRDTLARNAAVTSTAISPLYRLDVDDWTEEDVDESGQLGGETSIVSTVEHQGKGDIRAALQAESDEDDGGGSMGLPGLRLKNNIITFDYQLYSLESKQRESDVIVSFRCTFNPFDRVFARANLSLDFKLTDPNAKGTMKIRHFTLWHQKEDCADVHRSKEKESGASLGISDPHTGLDARLHQRKNVRIESTYPLAAATGQATLNDDHAGIEVNMRVNGATDVGLLGSWQIAFVLDGSCKGQEVEAGFRLEAFTKSGMESAWTKKMTTGKRSGPRRRFTFTYANTASDGSKAP